jgi:pSer/pThr/pTyr-binding forkhead associated (FHA) protein
MPAVEEFHEEQTVTFRAPAGWGTETHVNEAVHFLLLIEPNVPPRRIAVPSLPATIGRTAPADIVLEGGTVSRRHCRLELAADRLLISDLGSTNGTFVNGIRLTSDRRLAPGDIVKIGETEMRFER